MKIFEHTLIDRMKLFLDYSTRRQKVISSNLANVDTPGYRTRDLDFKEVFRKESEGLSGMRVGHSRHLGQQPVLLREPVVREVKTGSLGNDLNNVDLDREMTNLATNVLKFSTVVQFMKMKLRMLESSIRGG